MDKKIYTTKFKLFNCKSSIISVPDEMNFFLENLVKFIGMQKIPESLIGSKNPSSFEFKPLIVTPDEYGVTGSILLFESNIAMHSWINRNRMAYLIICSCKEYDVLETLYWIQEHLDFDGYDFDTIVL